MTELSFWLTLAENTSTTVSKYRRTKNLNSKHIPKETFLNKVQSKKEKTAMYITLFIIVLIVGLLMVLLPSKAIKNLVNQNGVLVVLRLLGIIMCVASSVTIYALVAGKIVLPLIK